jgi:methyl-accepting chemotaxis protein
VVVYQLISEIDGGIDFAQKERLGVQYNSSLRKLLESLIEYRHLLKSSLLRNTSNTSKTDLQTKLSKQQSKIELEIKAIDAVDLQLGNTLKTTTKWSDLKQKWQEAKNRLPVQESLDTQSATIDDLISLMLHVGDTSKLITDPVLDSYYLMDAVVTKLPATIANSAKARDLNSQIVEDKKITEEEKAQVILLSSEIKTPNELVWRGLKVAFDSNPQLKTKIENELFQAFTTTNNLLKVTNQQIEANQNFASDQSQYITTATTAINANFKLYDAVAPALDNLLQERLQGFENKKNLVLVFSILVLIVIVGVLLVLARSLTKHQESEKALRQAEAKYRIIFENAVDGIFQTTPD